MKFLENTKLEALASALSVETQDCRLETRVESYSCKMVQSDKKLWKEMMQAGGPSTSPHDPQPLSPPIIDNPWAYPQQSGNAVPSTSPGNRLTVLRNRHRSRSTSGSDQDQEMAGAVLCDSISRKMLFDLVALMNASFPDYDFTDAKGENFHRVPSLEVATSQINSQLAALVDNYGSMKSHVWSIIDEEIKLKECNIYSYNPDYSSDPFAEDGCIWSFNYFFYNKRLKRIVFFACRAQSIRNGDDSSFDDQIWNMDT